MDEETVEVVILVVMGLVATGFWFLAFVNMFRMVANRKPGVPLFPSFLESPFNILFRPRQLTEKGLKARRRVIIGFFGFLICCIVAMVGLTIWQGIGNGS